MLATNIFLYNTAHVTDATWTAVLYFQQESNAKFIKVGDFVETNYGSIFVIETWNTYPNFGSSGMEVTMTERTRNANLVDDTAYTSKVYTPNLHPLKPDYSKIDVYTMSSTRIKGKPYSFLTELYFYQSADKAKLKKGDWLVKPPNSVYKVEALEDMGLLYPTVILTDVNYTGATLTAGDGTIMPSTGKYDMPVPSGFVDPQMHQALQETQIYLLDSIVPAKIRKPEYFVGETLPLGSLVYLDPVTQELRAATSVSSGGFTVIGALDTDCDFGDYSTVTSNGLFRNTNWNFPVENIGSEVCLSIANPGELVLLSDIDEESLNPGDIVQTIGTIVGPDVLDINLGIKIYK